jgi:hypothetical protein
MTPAKRSNNTMEVPSTVAAARTSSNANNAHSGPVDLDALFKDDDSLLDDDDQSLFSLLEEQAPIVEPIFFNNPNQRLLDNDASLIPGSPFSKPPNRPSNRPQEPLALARYASILSCVVTGGWVVYLLFAAIWYYVSVGRIVLEVLLAILSFFGLFWNSFFSVSSVLKCFIPRRAFTTNTKYCSIIPETADANATWLDVTIQIPVYKESLKEVLMPTLNSCLAARDYYVRKNGSGAKCNIVICDDGMMAMLRDK